ncbi:MAG: DNA mismatch repair endonuclease MutL [Phycisphaerales bacterium]|nr:DNA mismatch repair endonuclease MutL [Phycisphaerales bacterium]MBT7171154.1 DNA mismatch repair endonuclease MutL [Phycisphaerales bacterium]
MARINQLSKHLVNKIAAGEVIERPASVLKELVENALDAGATRIDVVIEDGGKALIQITDNGSGISHKDLPLAFAPHATSKLSNEDDLFAIQTMGFRGEALASIASISHASLHTRTAESDEGWEVIATGDSVSDPAPTACAPGTTIAIRDLFFNTPARRKFLKTTNTEFGHLTEQLLRIALPNPQVAFTLRHNGRLTMGLPASDSTRQRISDAFTRDLAEGLIPLVKRSTDTVCVQGLIATPSAARGSGKWQYIFLNGRYIRDRMLSHALREAYRGLVAPTKYPVCFLFVEVDPAEVDVNVHPTKIEVRFRESNHVYGELLATLRETLNRSNLAPEVHTPAHGDEITATGEPQSATDAPKEEQSVRQALADFFKTAPAPPPRLQFSDSPQQAPAPIPPAEFAGGLSGSRERSPFAPAPIPPVPSARDLERDEHVTLSPPPVIDTPVLQIHNSYIVSQTSDGMTIIDQHALHERLLYNEFRRRLASGRLESQAMLIPEPVRVSPDEEALLEEHVELLTQLGFAIEPFGPSTVAIQKYPSLLAERNVEMTAFLREVLDHVAEHDTPTAEQVLEDILAVMSCKAAVKAGAPLSDDEMRDLLYRARECDKASACPHGRPTTIQLSLKELEKNFHRT